METTLLDGKKLSKEIYDKLIKRVSSIKEKFRSPKLVIILIGDDLASHTYVNHKLRACKAIGIDYELVNKPSNISEKILKGIIHKYNEDLKVDGIIVQLPLPKHIDIDSIISSIKPEKDVDGFHPLNYGKMSLGLKCHIPATPTGILEILKKYKIETSGKNCVIVGRSRIVGSPLSIMLSQKNYPGNCTVTLCNSQTKNLKFYTENADILVSAIGKNKFIKADMVKSGAVVIDVGINRVEDKNNSKGYRLEGDIDFENVKKKVSYITPVPGGVGPMTIASLLINTCNAAYEKLI